jgi:hypothetical protein
MTYWIILGITFIAVSYCFSHWIKKKYHIQDTVSGLAVITLMMLWSTFMLGLYLSTCLKFHV